MFACDIALIPDLNACEQVISWNKELLAQHSGSIRLATKADARFGLPHLSLFMAFADREEVRAMEKFLVEVSANLQSLQGRWRGPQSKPNRKGTKTWSMVVNESEPLSDLHRRCVSTFESFTGRQGELSCFACDEDDWSQTDADWVTHYRENSALENFDPHVTIGYGPGPLDGVEGEVVFNQLGLFQLGGGCTCRRPITIFKLGES